MPPRLRRRCVVTALGCSRCGNTQEVLVAHLRGKHHEHDCWTVEVPQKPDRIAAPRKFSALCQALTHAPQQAPSTGCKIAMVSGTPLLGNLMSAVSVECDRSCGTSRCSRSSLRFFWVIGEGLTSDQASSTQCRCRAGIYRDDQHHPSQITPAEIETVKGRDAPCADRAAAAKTRVSGLARWRLAD